MAARAAAALRRGCQRSSAVAASNRAAALRTDLHAAASPLLPQAQQDRRCRGDRARAGARWYAAPAAAGEVAAKEPEYASGDLSGYELFHHKEHFVLSHGDHLPELQVAYETWGELNERRDNAILLQCGMSASSHACSHAKNPSPGWWEEYIGPGKPLDTNIFFVICTNNLGGCFGTSGPWLTNPRTGKPWGGSFPRFKVQDMVRAQFLLLDHLGIQRVHAAVGASLGGMLSVASAAMFPERVGKFVSISACAKSFPGSIAFRHTQREAIMSDPKWNGGNYYDGELPADGLRLARQIGTITYRSGTEWQQRFGQRTQKGKAVLERPLKNELMIEHYLTHQGDKWVNNYDPNSMLWISKAMDEFSVELPDENGEPSLLAGLKKAQMPALVIGVQHDVLFPVWQQKQIADTLKAAGNKRVVYYELDSVYGHDAFLLEAVAMGPAIKGHLEQEPNGARQLWEDMAASSGRILQVMMLRSSSADSFRDIYRSLARGNESVPTDRLRAVLKFVLEGQVTSERVDTVFAEKMPGDTVTLNEFMGAREALLSAEPETYLP
eukprot:TRINITY_DN46321_c0_g1_i1.p1 TRINITY_DN46321_c0_g1~~TRINITY_DN46321_c0_g1_i1.p1  ORF type:complete len:553 (-),score=135.11 TRINITY_DN46321_c0_g1_i1:144-1802(-)